MDMWSISTAANCIALNKKKATNCEKERVNQLVFHTHKRSVLVFNVSVLASGQNTMQNEWVHLFSFSQRQK